MRRSKPIGAKPRGKYLAALEEFGETEECWSEVVILQNPAAHVLAKQFGKTPQDVAADINRLYVESYR